ncbi:hypothetical protein CsSME_00007848 [Camellia sinensis var. sinensis]
MVHLLRGLSVGLEINYSCAEQWRPIAEETLYLAGRLKGNDLKTGKCSRGLFKRIFGSGGIVKTEYMQAQIDLEVLWCSNSIVRSLVKYRSVLWYLFDTKICKVIAESFLSSICN